MAGWSMLKGRVGTAVLASLVTAAVVGGTATAAKLITGADVKDGSLTAADVKNGSLTGLDIRNGSVGAADLAPAVRRQLARTGAQGLAGAQGPVGAPGPAGADGPDGLPGADGDDAGSVVMGRITTVDVITGVDPVFGRVADSLTTDVPEPEARLLTADRELVAADFIARADFVNASGTGGIAVTLHVNGDPTALGCTIPDGQTTCASDQAVAIPGGSDVVMAVRSAVPAESVSAPNLRWALRLSAPAG